MATSTFSVGRGTKIGLTGLALTLLSGCLHYSAPRAEFHKTTPQLREEATGAPYGFVSGATIRGMSGEKLAIGQVGWGALLGGWVGSEIKAHPEMLVTELQNKRVNAFFVGETLVVALHADDYFYPGSTEVMPEVEDKLRTIANLLVRYSNQPIYVEGFSDDTGDIIDNIARAEARAGATAAYLWSAGVEPERFHLINHGSPDQTVADLATASGLADNRHIVICTKADPPRSAFDPLFFKG